jgi:DNA polymerase III subunit beta
MQVNLPQDKLAAALRTVGRAVPARHAITALTGVALTAGEQVLRLQATDLEVTLTCSVPASVITAGAAVLPGRYLQELVRRLPSGPVTLGITPTGASARLAWEDSECLVHLLPQDQFPVGEAGGPDSPGITLSSLALRRLLRETGFATGHDESRPWFTGVFLAVEGRKAITMATDAAVVAYSEAPVHNPAGLAFSVILPGRALQELTRLATETEADQVQVTPAHNQFCFHLGDTTLTTRLLEGQYPDFRRYLPGTYPSAVQMDRERFLAACERAALMADQSAVLLDVSDRGLRLTARAPELGEVTERLPATLEGAPFAVPLNVRYVLAGLRSMEAPSLRVEFASGRSAVRFRSSDEAQPFFAALPLLTF